MALKQATNGHGNGEQVTNCDGVNGHLNGHGSDNGYPSSYHGSLVYIVSAENAEVAQQLNKDLAKHIRNVTEAGTELSPKDLAYTLAEWKSRFPWVTAVRARNLVEFADKLDEAKASKVDRKPRLGFVFNGQGVQWHAMGRELIAEYAVFRRSLVAADAILKDFGAPWSLCEELMRDEKTTRVHELGFSQSCSVALQLCLVDLLASWDITPRAVTSHSSGEIAAAFAVGALTFQQALGVAYYRDEELAQQKNSGVAGSMLAVGLNAERAAEYAKDTKLGTVVVACHNSPESVTLSGDQPAVDEIHARLQCDGVFVRKLKVPAYHSHHMLPMARKYTDKLRDIMPVTTAKWNGTLFASPVTGDIVASPKVLGPEHFCENLIHPTLFAEALEHMCFSDLTSDGTRRPAGQDRNVDMIVEIGAHGALAVPIREVLGEERQMPYVSLLKRFTNATHTVQDAVCAMLAQGYPVPLAAVNGHQRGNYVVGLPAMPSTSRWEIEIAHEVPTAFKALLSIHLDESDVDFEKKLDRLSFNYILDAVKQLEVDDNNIERPVHLDRLHTWMKSVVAQAQAGQLGPRSGLWSHTNAGLKQRFADEVASENAAGKLTVLMGQQLAAIVRGHVDAEALLKSEEALLDQYYESMPRLAKRSCEQMQKVVTQLAVNRPGARVLEVGGRSGAITVRILRAFAARADEDALGTLLSHYDFTSPNSSNFEAVREKCAPWDAMMDFKTLDIAEDPMAQGFTAATYDLVIVVAGLAFGAAADLVQPLKHVSNLIKPGGKLVLLVENTHARLDTSVVFGGLADFQPRAVGEWATLLAAAGFAGVEMDVGDCEDTRFQTNSVILTTAVDAHAEPSTYPTAISVVHADNVRPDQTWLTTLQESIAEHMGLNMMVEAFSSVKPRPDVTYIFTPEMASPFPDGMDQASLDQLKALFLRGQGVLWLSRSGLVDANQPVYAQSSDLLRTARQEDPSKRYVLLDFPLLTEGSTWSPSSVTHVIRVLCQSFDGGLDHPNEYAIKDEMLHIEWRLVTSKLCSSNGVSSSAVSALITSPDEAFKQSLRSGAADPHAQTLAMMAGLMRKLAALLNLAEAKIDVTGSLAAVGVDSLSAIELKNWLSSVVQANVTIFEILQTATMPEFVELVAGRSALLA